MQDFLSRYVSTSFFIHIDCLYGMVCMYVNDNLSLRFSQNLHFSYFCPFYRKFANFCHDNLSLRNATNFCQGFAKGFPNICQITEITT